MIPALIAGAIGLGGAYLAHKGRAAQNKAQREEAQRDRDFQERMSSTAYQRATADMRLSGINPMLAYAQGGASSPGGRVAKIEDVVGPAVSSAMHLTRLKKEMDLMDAQTYKAVQDGYKAMADGTLAGTMNEVATYSAGTGQPSFRARLGRADALFKEAQANALRFSPFMSRYIGTEMPQQRARYRVPSWEELRERRN